MKFILALARVWQRILRRADLMRLRHEQRRRRSQPYARLFIDYPRPPTTNVGSYREALLAQRRLKLIEFDT